MIQQFARRSVLRAGIALGVCGLAPRVRACEFFAANLRIYLPWTRATAQGDSHAVLCATFDEVTQADRLIGIETPVAAGAEMGGAGARGAVDFVLPQGRESVLSESGVHVRLLGLKHPLELGRTYPMKFVLEQAGVVAGAFDVSYERLA